MEFRPPDTISGESLTSLRLLGRKVYLSTVVTLIAAMLHGTTRHCWRVCRNAEAMSEQLNAQGDQRTGPPRSWHTEGRRQLGASSLEPLKRFTDQIQSLLDLAVPQSPADAFNRLSEESAEGLPRSCSASCEPFGRRADPAWSASAGRGRLGWLASVRRGFSPLTCPNGSMLVRRPNWGQLIDTQFIPLSSIPSRLASECTQPFRRLIDWPCVRLSSFQLFRFARHAPTCKALTIPGKSCEARKRGFRAVFSMLRSSTQSVADTRFNVCKSC